MFWTIILISLLFLLVGMAGSFSDYLEDKLLNHVFGGTSYSPPATLYVGLFTAAPSDSGGGTEVTGGSYARVSLTNNTTNFPNASGTSPTSKTNGTTITFPTASANWGIVVAVGIFDASSGGNLICWADLTASKTVNNGDTASFAASSLAITLV